MDNLTKKSVILMNGPPNSGKDEITKAICNLTGATHMEFKEHLYQCTATLFNWHYEEFKRAATGRLSKETKFDTLQIDNVEFYKLMKSLNKKTPVHHSAYLPGKHSLTPREALIYISELVIKPNFGVNYFGEIAANNMGFNRDYVFSDSGFKEELTPVIRKFGTDNVFIVKLFRDGTSFEGDSRDYLDVPEGVATLDLFNNDTIESAVAKVLSWHSNLKMTEDTGKVYAKS